MWWSGKTLAAVLPAWAEAVREAKTHRMGVARALFSYANMLKRKALRSWFEGVIYRQQKFQKLQMAMSAMAGHRLCLCFDAWYANGFYLPCTRTSICFTSPCCVNPLEHLLICHQV